jgi:hypothetical protein
MTRFVSGVTGLIGAVALVVAGSAVELHAQRGNAGGHGRPANPGAQGQAHRPDTTHPTAADHTEHGKSGDHATATTGRAAVGDQLARNTNLMTRLQALFPAGTDLKTEASQFRNLGQFVAAAHVSHNLDIPWTDMKGKMTGDHPVSLGQAIQDLKPQADAKTEADKATKEANTDIKDSAKTKS